MSLSHNKVLIGRRLYEKLNSKDTSKIIGGSYSIVGSYKINIEQDIVRKKAYLREGGRLMKYACPCCGYRTFDEQIRGSHSICPVCFWEDDGLQCELPDEAGANVPLRVAQKNFRQYGATQKEVVEYVTKDRTSFEYEGPLDLTEYRAVHIEEMARIFLALDINLEKLLELYTMRHIRNMKLEFMLEELFPYMKEQEMYDYYALKVDFDLFREQSSIGDKSEEEQQERYKEIIEKFKSKLIKCLNFSG